MSSPGHLEWVQCKRCGRRQRWKAELAGTEVLCACGHRHTVPRGDASDGAMGTGFDANDTLVDPSLTNEAASINEGLPRVEHGSMLLEEEARRIKAEQARIKRGRKNLDSLGGEGIVSYSSRRPIGGMSRPQNLVFWLGTSLLAFAVVMLGVMNINYWVLGAGGLVLLVSLIKLPRAYRLWRGNRSLKRAWAEAFMSDSERQAEILLPPTVPEQFDRE